MKSLPKRIVILALAALLGATPMAQLGAQDQAAQSPAVVVSIANADELMADIDYLTRTANAQQVGGMVQVFTAGVLQLMDRTKPAGVYVTIEQGAPRGIGFLPVRNLDMALAQLQGMIGPAQDVGNGVKRLGGQGGGQTVFVKGQNGWAFFSDNAGNLANLPQDPTQLLGELPNQYNLAVRINVQSIPEPFRQMAVSELKAGFERQFAQNQDLQDEADRELAEKLSRNSMQQIVSLIEESDQVTFGWQVDSQAKITYMDLSITALEGTDLAGQMNLLQDSETDFAGFQLADAAATLSINSKIPQRDIEQTKLMLQAVREKAMQELENDPELDDAETKATAKEVVNTLLDVVAETIESGKLDGGAVVLMDPEAVRIALGGYVADGAALEEALKKLVQIGQKEPDFPEVTFDAETHAGVRFHKLSVPIPEDEEDAQQLFGQQLDVVVGISDQSVYVALGKESAALLKQVVDQSASGTQQQVPPMLLKVAVAPILQVAAAMQEEDAGLKSAATTAQQVAGSDHISLRAEPIERGVRYRLEVEEGVLAIVGAAIQQKQQAAAQQGGAFPQPQP